MKMEQGHTVKAVEIQGEERMRKRKSDGGH
jgi:hypothetical protein